MQGGVTIEDIAEDNPGAIIKEPIDIKRGLTPLMAVEIATRMKFTTDKYAQPRAALSCHSHFACELLSGLVLAPRSTSGREWGEGGGSRQHVFSWPESTQH